MRPTFKPDSFIRCCITPSAIAAVAAFASLTGCYQGIRPDPNPPKVYILAWQHNPDGTQGSQISIGPGGQLTVPGNWLGANQADIRVYGDSTYGVTQLEVSGSTSGTCYYADSNMTQYHSPTPLPASFPTHVETAPSGTTRSPMAYALDQKVLLNASCGVHSFYNGSPPNVEYTITDPTVWTVTASTVNGSGLKTTATFTINLQY